MLFIAVSLGLFSSALAQAHGQNQASAHFYEPPNTLAGVSCQTDWIQSGTARGMGGYVTAWQQTNTPTYNAQCGKCIKLTSTESGKNLGKSIYVTVVDLKGAGGFDVNVQAWYELFGTTTLDVYNTASEEVNPCNCIGNGNL